MFTPVNQPSSINEPEALGTDLPPIPNHSATQPGELHIVPLSEVEPEPIQWLWDGYLAIGKFAILEGLPGLGKSAVSLDLAARLSVGSAMPDGANVGDPADTLVLSYEDAAADTLRPRVQAAGGDPTRVHHIVGTASKQRKGFDPTSLPNDLDALERALGKRPTVRLLVIDPLVGALGANVDANRDQDVRRVLMRLADIAAAYHVTVLAVRHHRKGRGGPAITAGAGSIGIVGVARGSLVVSKDPDDEEASVLASVKMNLGPTPPSLGFRKCSATISTGAGELTTLRLEWTGERGLSADQLVSARAESDTGRASVDGWLEAALSVGAVDRSTLIASARTAGIAPRSLQRAATRLQIVLTREGRRGQHRSVWSLPEESGGAEATRATFATRATSTHVARVENVARVDDVEAIGSATSSIDGPSAVALPMNEDRTVAA